MRTKTYERAASFGGAALSIALPPLCRVGSIRMYGTREGFIFSMTESYPHFFYSASYDFVTFTVDATVLGFRNFPSMVTI